jgi:hypothetical protein
MSARPVLDTFALQAAPGIVNPVRRNVQYQNLHINTLFRENYYATQASDFFYNIPTSVRNVIAISLASIDIPFSWYLFSACAHNNMFVVEVSHECAPCTAVEIVIPEGNYTREELEEVLNEEYFYKCKRETPLSHLRFRIIERTMRSCFEIIGEPPRGFEYAVKFVTRTDQNILSTAGWTLGFRYAQYTKQTGVLLSEGLFDAGGDRYVYVSLSDHNYNTNDANIVCLDKSIVTSDIIAKVYLKDGAFQINIDTEMDNPASFAKTRRYNGPVNLNRLHISLLDKFGETIPMNSMDFSLTLQVELLYENIQSSESYATTGRC